MSWKIFSFGGVELKKYIVCANQWGSRFQSECLCPKCPFSSIYYSNKKLQIRTLRSSWSLEGDHFSYARKLARHTHTFTTRIYFHPNYLRKRLMDPSWLSSVNLVFLTLEGWYFRRNQYILRFCDKSSVKTHETRITSLNFLLP